MDSEKFIEEFILIDEIKQFDKKLFVKKEKLKKYIYYLDLIEYEYFRKYLYICNIMPYVWRGYLNNNIQKHLVLRYTQKMLSENFIEEIEPSEENISFLVTRCNLNRFNAERTILYRITDKGRRFLKLRDVENYLSYSLDDKFKSKLEKDYNDIFN
jgi:hypothetical protein